MNEGKIKSRDEQKMDVREVAHHDQDHHHHHEATERPLSQDPVGDDRKPKVCRVCGDRALSVNFNVVTCESCKAFFRRNALKPKAFRCPFSGVCDINVVSRKFCKKCRLRKCFEVGMMKEWIMSDEARLKKRDLISTNREKRRTVIMATVAKHGLDTSDADKLASAEDASCLDGSRNQSFADDGYLSSERSNDEILSNDFLPHEALITVPKAALFELAIQCRCQYKDLNSVVDEFVERHSINGASGQSAAAIAQQKTSVCGSIDCLCTEYRPKVPNLNVSQKPIGNLTAQVHLPTLSGDEAASGNTCMLSFLAPSFGKYCHSVEYPLPIGTQGVVSPSRPPTANPLTSTPWTDSVARMPMVPLDLPPHIYDLVNIPLQHPSTLSCPLPIRLVTQQDDAIPPLLSDEMAKMPTLLSTDGKIAHEHGSSPFGETSPTSILGKLSRLPYTMLPRLKELLDAKKFLLIEEQSNGNRSIAQQMDDPNGVGKGEKIIMCDGPEAFFKHVSAFNLLLEPDRIALLKANHTEIAILRQVIFYEVFQSGAFQMGPDKNGFESKRDLEICEKYLKVIPRQWRHDDCIMLTLMAIAVFNTTSCQLLCKNAIEQQREFYMELLKRYFECTYKFGEAQTAQHALLDIIGNMRYEKAAAVATPEARFGCP